MLCWIVIVWYISPTHCNIARDSMLYCCIVSTYCSNSWHTVATVRYYYNSGNSHNMLCQVMTAWYNNATYCHVVPDSMFYCWIFPPACSISDFLKACADDDAMLLHFTTACWRPDSMVRRMNTICKYGTKFNMLAGHLAIRPFSPCDCKGPLIAIFLWILWWHMWDLLGALVVFGKF
jgi:hypothetical protein